VVNLLRLEVVSLLRLEVVSLTGICRLPPKVAGKAEVKFTFSVDIEGNMRIEKMSLDTGKKIEILKKANWLIEET